MMGRASISVAAFLLASSSVADALQTNAPSDGGYAKTMEDLGTTNAVGGAERDMTGGGPEEMSTSAPGGITTSDSLAPAETMMPHNEQRSNSHMPEDLQEDYNDNATNITPQMMPHHENHSHSQMPEEWQAYYNNTGYITPQPLDDFTLGEMPWANDDNLQGCTECDDFACYLETPRNESTCVCVDEGTCEDYRDFLHKAAEHAQKEMVYEHGIYTEPPAVEHVGDFHCEDSWFTSYEPFQFWDEAEGFMDIVCINPDVRHYVEQAVDSLNHLSWAGHDDPHVDFDANSVLEHPTRVDANDLMDPINQNVYGNPVLVEQQNQKKLKKQKEEEAFDWNVCKKPLERMQKDHDDWQSLDNDSLDHFKKLFEMHGEELHFIEWTMGKCGGGDSDNNHNNNLPEVYPENIPCEDETLHLCPMSPGSPHHECVPHVVECSTLNVGSQMCPVSRIDSVPDAAGRCHPGAEKIWLWDGSEGCEILESVPCDDTHHIKQQYCDTDDLYECSMHHEGGWFQDEHIQHWCQARPCMPPDHCQKDEVMTVEPGVDEQGRDVLIPVCHPEEQHTYIYNPDTETAVDFMKEGDKHATQHIFPKDHLEQHMADYVHNECHEYRKGFFALKDYMMHENEEDYLENIESLIQREPDEDKKTRKDKKNKRKNQEHEHEHNHPHEEEEDASEVFHGCVQVVHILRDTFGKKSVQNGCGDDGFDLCIQECQEMTGHGPAHELQLEPDCHVACLDHPEDENFFAVDDACQKMINDHVDLPRHFEETKEEFTKLDHNYAKKKLDEMLYDETAGFAHKNEQWLEDVDYSKMPQEMMMHDEIPFYKESGFEEQFHHENPDGEMNPHDHDGNGSAAVEKDPLVMAHQQKNNKKKAVSSSSSAKTKEKNKNKKNSSSSQTTKKAKNIIAQKTTIAKKEQEPQKKAPRSGTITA